MLYVNNNESYNYDVEPAKGYNEPYAMAMITLESVVTEGLMLDSLMKRDVREASAILNEDAGTREVILQEGVKEIGSSIKDYVLKVWAKVKALFDKFITKLNGVLIRDSAALFKKYQKEWVANANKKIKKWKFKKMEQTIEKSEIESLGKNLDGLKNIIPEIEAMKEEVSFEEGKGGWASGSQKAHYDPKSYKYTGDPHIQDYSGSSYTRKMAVDDVINKQSKQMQKVKIDIDKIEEELSDGTAFNKYMQDCFGINTDKKSFAKDFEEWIFGDEETGSSEVIPSDIRQEVQAIMTNKKLISDVQSAKTKINSKYTKLLKEIDQATKRVIDKEIANPTANQVAMKYLNVFRRYVQMACEATNMSISVYLKAVKFHVAQCRRIFMQTVAGSHVKEDTMMDAIGEAAEYEVYSSFEDFE